MLEAMQEGVPVLASDIPVHKQLIAHKRGMLFIVNDQDSCARSLDWALHHPQELAVMARNAQEYVETYFNWDDITTNTLRFYQELVCPLVPAVPVTPKCQLSKTAKAEC
jgi:glycosyltransferase involved in cell wall biosynthesis